MSSQHVVIIGGSSGIGLATAILLLERGYEVTIAARNQEKLEAVRASNPRLKTCVFDATDPENIRSAFTAIGPFDHLVLAMGSGHGAGPFATLEIADLRAGFETKMVPHFASAQAALPFLREGGSITFVSAVSARSSMPGTAGLAAVNAAIEALVPVLAVELKPLRVNAVSPGVVDTPWWDFLSSDQRGPALDGFASRTPVGRVGKPQDIAETIAFLVANGFMSGHVVVCDGGIRLAAA